MQRMTSAEAAIPLDFDPGALLQDADLLMDEPDFNSWLLKTIGGDQMDEDDTEASSQGLTGAGPSGSPSSGLPDSSTGGPDDSPPAATNSGSNSGAAAAPAVSMAAGAAAAGPRALVAQDRLVRVPSGHELVQVGPGLYEMRPIKAATTTTTTATSNGAAPAPTPAAAAVAPPAAPQPAAPVVSPFAGPVSAAPATEASAKEQFLALANAAAVQHVQQEVEARLQACAQGNTAAPPDAFLSHAQSQLRTGLAGAQQALQTQLQQQLQNLKPGALGSTDSSGQLAAAAAVRARLAAAAGGGGGRGGAAGGGRGGGRTPGKKQASSQRFRERQKGLISELENEVVHKLEQLQLLERENGVLKLKSSVLERAVEGRDEQLRIMRTYGVQWRKTPKDGAAAGGDGCSAGGGFPGGGAPSLSGLLCPSGLPPGGAHPGGEERAAEIASWIEEKVPTIEEIKSMTAADLRQLWKAFLHRASRELMELQQEEEEAGGVGGGTIAGGCGSSATDPAASGAAAAAAAAGAEPKLLEGVEASGASASGSRGEAGGDKPLPLYFRQRALPEGVVPGTSMARLHNLVNRYMSVIKHMLLLNPTAGYPLVGLNLDTMLPQPAPDSFWRGVVAQLRLGAEQMADFLAIHELFTLHSSRILAERATLQARLGAGMPAGQRLNAAAGLSSMLIDSANAIEVADALAANIKKEHTLRLLLECFIYGRVLTSAQLARAAVFSYPLIPDIASMVRVLGEDAAAISPHGGRRIFGESAAAPAALMPDGTAQYAATLQATAGAAGGAVAPEAAAAAIAAAAAFVSAAGAPHPVVGV